MTFAELREAPVAHHVLPPGVSGQCAPPEHALKLAALVDDWDHSRGVSYRRAELKNLLADLVICTEKMANETGSRPSLSGSMRSTSAGPQTLQLRPTSSGPAPGGHIYPLFDGEIVPH